MKLFYQWISLFAIVIFFSGCVNCGASKKPYQTKQSIKLHHVTNIQASGITQLKIYTGKGVNQATVEGLNIDLKNITIDEKAGTLLVSEKNINKNTPVTVTLYLRHLNRLSLDRITSTQIKALGYEKISIAIQNSNNISIQGNMTIPSLEVSNIGYLTTSGRMNIYSIADMGNGHLNIQNLASDKLIVNKQGDGILLLRGEGNVTQIAQTGKGLIDARWVKSQTLQVDASGYSQTKLAGLTKILTVHLTDNASLDAQYLFAKTIYVKTFNNTDAKVKPLRYLMAYATDHSLIRYYGNPKYLYKHPVGSGVIIQQ